MRAASPGVGSPSGCFAARRLVRPLCSSSPDPKTHGRFDRARLQAVYRTRYCSFSFNQGVVLINPISPACLKISASVSRPAPQASITSFGECATLAAKLVFLVDDPGERVGRRLFVHFICSCCGLCFGSLTGFA
jgi:hypothetical protein